MPGAAEQLVRATRLAPSPTGALHLGNARTFLITWALARQRGWRVLMRIEDLDGPRVKSGADLMAIEDLAWLGLDWDGEVLYQRADLSPYTAALATLEAAGLVYPCACTRSEIERAQSAPHANEHELRYPGTCRHRAGGAVAIAEASALRVRAPEEAISFVDQINGPQRFNVQEQVGDFIVATKADLPAYQLAVVVDDARQGVTDVIRGDDLLGSTARQIYLYRVLRLGPPPRYWHLPLVLGPDGRRLAKRHGDTRIALFRERGVPAERVVGLLARWSGVLETNAPLTAREFAERFTFDRLCREPVTLTDEDVRWLLT